MCCSRVVDGRGDTMESNNNKLSYSEYIEICEHADVPVGDRLTENEWNEPFESSPDHLMRAIGKGGFGSFGKVGQSVIAGKLAGQAVDAIINEINASVNTDELPGRVKDFVKARFRRGSGSGSDDGTNGGVRTPTPGGMSGGSDFTGRQLSLNPRPYAININSGIKHNTAAKVRLDASDSSSPLHISTVKLNFPQTGQDPRFKSWWDINVTNKFQTLAQRRVGFNVNSTTVFSSSRLFTYYTTMANALMCYYSFAKPLIYSPSNRNDGVTFWRKNITPADIDLITQLHDALNNEPIPPFLNAWIFQCYGVYYRTSMNPNSSLWGLHSESLGTTSGTVFQGTDDSTPLSTNLAFLTNPDFRSTSDMIARVFPSWSKDEKLFTTPSVAEYSPNMNTLFANLPFVGGLGYPRVSNSTENIVYNTYADSLDGLVLACSGAFNISISNWVPSLMVPVANDCNNGSTAVSRLSYSNLSGTEGMQWAGEFTRLSYSRGETYTNVGSTCHAFDKFGTEQCLFVSQDSIREVAYLALEKLVGLDSDSTSSYKETTAAEDASSDKPKRSRNRRKK